MIDDAKWERWSALGGVLFAVLISVSGLMTGEPPKTSDSTAKIADFVNDHRDAIRWQAFLGALATIGLLWFLGAVWRVLRRAESGQPRLTVVAVAGALFAAALAAVSSVVLATMGIVGAGGDGRASLRVVYVLSTNLGFAPLLGIAVFLSAFSVLIIRHGMFPRWLGWVGLLIALVSVVGVVGVSSTRDVFQGFGLAGFVTSALWLLVISIMMVAGRGSEARASAA